MRQAGRGAAENDGGVGGCGCRGVGVLVLVGVVLLMLVLVQVTDSTIAPPAKTIDFFNELFAAGQYEETCYMKIVFLYIFLFAKDYRNMTSGWQGAPCFGRYGRGLVSKPAISSSISLGGHRRATQVLVLLLVFMVVVLLLLTLMLALLFLHLTGSRMVWRHPQSSRLQSSSSPFLGLRVG